MKVQIEPYNPDWRNAFKREAAWLRELLPDIQFDIEHIGSTAVPGLSAKPVVDMMPGFDNEADLQEFSKRLYGQSGLVYYEIFEDTMPHRRLFIKAKVLPDRKALPKIIRLGEKLPNLPYDIRISHLHGVCKSHPFWDRHLLFRDYLRNHDSAMKDYEQLKLDLAKKEWETTNQYAVAKTEFIEGIIQKAILERDG